MTNHRTLTRKDKVVINQIVFKPIGIYTGGCGLRNSLIKTTGTYLWVRSSSSSARSPPWFIANYCPLIQHFKVSTIFMAGSLEICLRITESGNLRVCITNQGLYYLLRASIIHQGLHISSGSLHFISVSISDFVLYISP